MLDHYRALPHTQAHLCQVVKAVPRMGENLRSPSPIVSAEQRSHSPQHKTDVNLKISRHSFGLICMKGVNNSTAEWNIRERVFPTSWYFLATSMRKLRSVYPFLLRIWPGFSLKTQNCDSYSLGLNAVKGITFQCRDAQRAYKAYTVLLQPPGLFMSVNRFEQRKRIINPNNKLWFITV